MTLTQQTLKDRLFYNPVNGEFTRLKVRGKINQHLIGKRAGRINTNGHRQIRIDGKPYLAHRLAWLYITGEWPDEQIDHIDLQKDNNSFSNLRLCSSSQNLANSPISSRNTSGFKGATFVPKLRKYKAQIRKDQKHYYLGLYDTAVEAGRAYAEAADRLYGSFARY